ncbi:hypothetical protein DMB92_08405 [Campylobacter sp. MIT 99-7217]|uniref:DUF1353 domain-containing protein n=1 Tax=Campylobacter sp. MIT 99-7217 TaxID=535091 RepID=UPI001159205D|nr:DUF1353 domain-containing protein [Campylobacter sp. MIT 99-7217]TQR29148.1 hypothetical protein DMB92_08405 [Campylobacter sp. MIT 99-7217]
MSEVRRVVVKPHSKDKYELMQDYECAILLNKEGFFGLYELSIKAGFITNGADIPRFLWSFFPPNSPEYLSAVVVHDFLCEKASSRKDYKLADLMFKEAMHTIGVSKLKIKLFYNACNLYHTLKFLFKKEGK